MNDPKEKIKRKRILTLLTVLGIVLFSWMLFAFLYSPQLGELKRLRSEVLAKQAQIAKEVDKQSAAVHVSREELEKWQGKIDELGRRLPEREDFEILLYDIGKMARSMRLQDFRLRVETNGGGEEIKNGSGKSSREVSVTKRKEKEAAMRKTIESLPVSAAVLKIDFTSRYREMASFLEGLTKNARAMSLDEIKLGREGDRMVAQITINAYYREQNGKANW